MSLVGIDNIELYSDTKCDFTPPTILLGFSFALGHGISFFGGIQHSPVDSCSASSCNFGVLAGKDNHMPFFSAILCELYPLCVIVTELLQLPSEP